MKRNREKWELLWDHECELLKVTVLDLLGNEPEQPLLGGHEAPPKWMEMVPHYLFASTSQTSDGYLICYNICRNKLIRSSIIDHLPRFITCLYCRKSAITPWYWYNEQDAEVCIIRYVSSTNLFYIRRQKFWNSIYAHQNRFHFRSNKKNEYMWTDCQWIR